jgi:hypothetical protein
MTNNLSLKLKPNTGKEIQKKYKKYSLKKYFNIWLQKTKQIYSKVNKIEFLKSSNS